MSVAYAPTGSALGNFQHLASLRDDGETRRTPIAVVNNPALRSAMEYFDDVLGDPFAPLRVFVRTPSFSVPMLQDDNTAVRRALSPHLTLVFNDARTVEATTWSRSALSEIDHEIDLALPYDPPTSVRGTADVVTVIVSLSQRLGLPLRDILEAAAVKRSSFYSWRPTDAPRPRLASQGRLWEMAQFVEDLEELLGGTARHWILAVAQRRDDLAQGRFSDLLESVRTRSQSDVSAPAYAANYAVGGDRIIDEDAELRQHPKGRLGATTSARTTKRTKD